MKFSCTKDNLTSGLSVASHVAAKTTTLPILQNILVTATDGGVTLTATNLDTAVRVRVRGKVETPGDLTVPAQVFSNYCGLITDDRIDILTEEETMHISAASQNSKIKGQNANDFPLIPSIERSNPIRIATADFSQALAQTVVATAKDQNRPALAGVFIQLGADSMTLAATDSYRLAERTIPCKRDTDTQINVIVPATALQEVLRAVSSTSEEEITLFVEENQALVVAGDVEVIISRLIDGRFPDYKQIIPSDPSTTVIVNKDELIQGIKAASLFSRSGINDINLHLSPENQAITITTVNNQLGENVTKVQAEIKGESNNSIFNYRYVLDGLAQISTPQVRIELIDNATPGIFRPQTEESNAKYQYIIMPIKQ